MNKLMKFISVFLTSIVLIVSAIPSVSAVYASEQVSQIETNMELQPVRDFDSCEVKNSS
ncbi:Uncharacterised protein [Streptococcus pneumoniae]|nr:Uncharacterised protein [Streptococcus pneumoniae]